MTILCYHDPRPELFSAHVDVLRNWFSPMPLREYVRCRNSESPQPLPNYPLILTIDDGHARNAQLSEAIAKTGVPVTIFLTSSIVGTTRQFWWTALQSKDDIQRLKSLPNEKRLHELASIGFVEAASRSERQALTRDEVNAMASHVDFQAHTRFHPILPQCDTVRARHEIQGSKEELEHNFGLHIYALAYPNGDYSDHIIALTKQAGFSCALALHEEVNDHDTDLYKLKRITIPDDATINELIVRASGLWGSVVRLRGKIFRGRGGGHHPQQPVGIG